MGNELVAVILGAALVWTASPASAQEAEDPLHRGGANFVAPAPVVSPAPLPELRVEVERVDGSSTPLRLHVRAAGTRDRWHFVCVAPCLATPVAGAWELALAEHEGDTVVPINRRTLDLTESGTLELRFSTRENERIGGLVALGIAAAGFLATLTALALDSAGSESLGVTLFLYVPFFIIEGVAMIVGTALALRRPSANARMVP
jgi:hypothetical protein